MRDMRDSSIPKTVVSLILSGLILVEELDCRSACSHAKDPGWALEGAAKMVEGIS